MMSVIEEDTRRFRLRYLIRECGNIIFKYKVEEKAKPLTLEDFLQDPEKKQQLVNLREKHVITKEQYELLYPDSGAMSADGFDITLRMVLLRTFCCSRPCCDPIWYKGSKPMVNDLSLEADLVRIRDHKNELEDASLPKLTAESFEEKWKDLCEVFIRLGSGNDLLKGLLDSIKTMPFDEEDKKLKEDFKTWEKMEQEFESGLDLTVTYSKSRRFKLYSLIVDCGTRVFRHVLDDRIPPEHLQSTISSYYGQLTILETKGIINVSQHDLLYPSSGLPSSATFDITLLTVLLRNICGLDPYKSVWSPRNPPLPTDNSLEADIVRIKDNRNKLYHLSQSGDLTNDSFEVIWEDITKVLLRLDGACREPLPNLQEEIDTLKRKTVDPKRETELQSVIEEWSKMDQMYESEIIQTILKHSPSEGAIERSKETVKDVLADKYFVKTSQFEEARKTLADNNIIVLNGAPGEGKTTVAKKLLAEVSQKERYIQLHSYTDWDSVIFDNVDAVLIDDMFGSGVFDKEEYRKWQKHIPSIAAAVTSKRLFVVITSRSYILTEALERMYVKSIFTQKNIVTLSSALLSNSEKKEILTSHFTKAARKDARIRDISSQSEHSLLVNDIIELKLDGPEVCLTIGFPECARLFANNSSLYKERVKFFESPMACVKSYMSRLLDDDDTFIAFFVLWAQQSKQLSSIELERPINNTSKDITDPICKLQFRPEDHVRKIRRVLQKHRGGFIHFDYKHEKFSFSHRVVQDAVGLVSYEINATATIELCDSAFIENFIRVDTNVHDEETTNWENRESAQSLSTPRPDSRDPPDKADSYTEMRKCVKPVIHLSHARYPQLSLRLGTLILSTTNIDMIQRSGFPETYIDPSPLKTVCFENKAFCAQFLDVLKKQNLLRQFLTMPTRTLVIEFAEYRFLKRVNTEIRLPAYLIWIREEICPLTEMCLDFMSLEMRALLKEELRIALLLSVKLGSRTLVECLIEKGATVDITHVSLAIVTGKEELMDLLFERNCFLSEKNILHDVCKAGYAEVVSKLLQVGFYTKQLTDSGNSMIQCAILGGHVETFKLLLEYDLSHAEMSFQVEGNDSSLFHFVVSQQNHSLIDVLLKSGIRPTKVDNEGRTPFLYAICFRKTRVVEKLMDISKEHDVLCRPDNNNNTPLYKCMEYSVYSTGRDSHVFYETAIKLCRYEENIHLMNSQEDSPILFACRHGLTHFVNEILKFEDPLRNEGTTIFHKFVTAGDSSRIATLLKSDIDPNIHDQHHRTPFMLANALGKTSVIRQLKTDQRIIKYNKEMGIVMANTDTERPHSRRPRLDDLQRMSVRRPTESL